MFLKYVAGVEGVAPKEVKIKVDYDLGGFNCWSGKNDGRGYYVYVTPVERKTERGFVCESFALMEGFKMFIKGVARRSAKAEAEADAIAAGMVEELVIKCRATVTREELRRAS